MPTLSRSVNPVQVPIERLPYDVLQEIFIHCLPEEASSVSSHPKFAPMLLCHICSFWRMVALTSPKLWSHLYCSLHIYYPDSYSAFSPASSSAFQQKQIEHLQWWEKNCGSMPPYITISIRKTDHYGPKTEPVLVDGNSETVRSVLNFLTSAQYLDAHEFFWDEIRRRMNRGDRILFPNLRFLVQKRNGSEYHFLQDQVRIGSLGASNNVISPLRYLHVEKSIRVARFLANSSIPSHWSTLTRISFVDVHISLHFWHSLIHFIPNLQWGYFYIHRCNVNEGNSNTAPVEYTQNNLTTLFVILDSHPISFLFDMLFRHLHLPALQTLTLDSDAVSWTTDHDDALIELYSILQSAPNISTLTLNHGFLSLDELSYSPPNSHVVEPVWNYARCLVHLKIEVFISNIPYNGQRNTVEERFDTLTDNLFNDDNRWLQLKHPACPIRKITFIDAASHVINAPKFAACHIHQVIRDMPFIDIRTTSEPGIYEIGHAWKEWDARVS